MSRQVHQQSTSAEKNGDSHERNHHGNFHERSNHGCKRGSRVDAEHGNGYRKFKIVAGSRKGRRCGFRVVGPDLVSHEKAHKKHHDKVNQQWHGDKQNIERNADDLIALEAEHDKDRKQQRDQSQGTNAKQLAPPIRVNRR